MFWILSFMWLIVGVSKRAVAARSPEAYTGMKLQMQICSKDLERGAPRQESGAGSTALQYGMPSGGPAKAPVSMHCPCAQSLTLKANFPQPILPDLFCLPSAPTVTLSHGACASDFCACAPLSWIVFHVVGCPPQDPAEGCPRAARPRPHCQGRETAAYSALKGWR